MTAREISRVEGPVGTSDEETEAAARELMPSMFGTSWERATKGQREATAFMARQALLAAASVAVPGAREADDEWVPDVHAIDEGLLAYHRHMQSYGPMARDAERGAIKKVLEIGAVRASHPSVREAQPIEGKP